ncbi:asparagine synthase (glutamine-hydrolysing) [Edaphobacter aggregans]|uniref:asparagine synthase (glutamine-hydrolyzing) n=1 Tax=Edaphobacter aggregans TaxID=570835 RepID=A0A428MJ60_9BACT|nr:asparagine synthase (glutamine-hydrolyzing) [Edaphobacter aggregans]RSL16991.1 asparagine synthase (glutamine-hydrolysing) [Edaphobacter aggregans]
MCGIAGYTHAEKDFLPERIHQAVASIVHRGPDQQGVWQSPTVSLGATRLRVIDTVAGAQPISSNDNDYTLVFNGEIYNHVELRKELIGHGHQFKTSCDTEVVLRAFMQWDTACIEKLRGMFAFAVWCESRQRLVLARDRMGIKPLYYARRGRDIYFGSELKAIFCHPEINRTIDLHALDTYLGLNYVAGPQTLAAGLVKLMPGCFLTWHDGEISTHRYWQADLADAVKPSSLHDATERLDHLLSASIKEHLAADVPVGIWLSGGIDSSTVLHYASQHTTTPLKTFSITFNGREFDESPYLREMAGRYSTEHHELDLGPSTVTPDSITEQAYYSDEPNADAGAVPVWHLSRMSAKEVTVALSGEGADELFGGYITYLADKYARRARMVPRSLRRLSLRSANRLRASNKKIGLDYKLQRFLHGTLMDERSSHIFWNGTFSQEQRSQLMVSHNSAHMLKLLATIPARGDLRRFMAFDQAYYLPDNLLVKVDRMSMAHSLEVRPAFLDHRIVEFAATLPAKYCIQGRTLKLLLRKLMKDKLPHSILAKKKQGLDIPVHDWLRGHLKPLLLDTLNRKTVEESGLVYWPHLDSLIKLHMERKANYGYHLWGMLMLFLWIKQWKIQCGQDIQALEDFSTVSV